MRKITHLLLLASFCFIATQSFAQIPKKPKVPAKPEKPAKPDKAGIKTEAFVKKSDLALEEAKKLVKIHKVYTGKLYAAVQHQKHAVQLLKDKKWRLTILHSWKARRLAFMAITANSGTIKEPLKVKPGEISPPFDAEKVKEHIAKFKEEEMGDLEGELEEVETEGNDEDVL